MHGKEGKPGTKNMPIACLSCRVRLLHTLFPYMFEPIVSLKYIEYCFG